MAHERPVDLYKSQGVTKVDAILCAAQVRGLGVPPIPGRVYGQPLNQAITVMMQNDFTDAARRNRINLAGKAVVDLGSCI